MDKLQFVEVIFDSEFLTLTRLYDKNTIVKKPKGELYNKVVGHICERHQAIWRNFALTGFDKNTFERKRY